MTATILVHPAAGRMLARMLWELTVTPSDRLMARSDYRTALRQERAERLLDLTDRALSAGDLSEANRLLAQARIAIDQVAASLP